MARGSKIALSFAGIYPVNWLELKNRFKRNLSDLLLAIEQELARPQRDPYAEVDPSRRPHEHDTRLLFVDKLLDLLGWQRGPQGDVIEEARLQADTTKFMDYVGVVDVTGEPLLLIEAKAWDKPSVSARAAGSHDSKEVLLAKAIQHIRDGKVEDTSPVIAEWDKYLRQVYGYVKALKELYHHDLPRAVIISGEWLVIFKRPVETFLGAVRPNDIRVITRSEYRESSVEILKLLHRTALTKDAPIPLRPTQLKNYVKFDEITGAYQGLHLHYERTGSKFFAPRPRILIYPALFVVRQDGTIFTVIHNENPIELGYRKDDDGVDTLGPHLVDIKDRGLALITACNTEFGEALPLAELSAFPGFRTEGIERSPIGDLPEADEWLIATGSSTHFLLESPRVQECRFHSWAQCGEAAASRSAINVRMIDPPAFFVDTQSHHCAHRDVLDRREERCLIQPIDSRTCCQACIYFDRCWDDADRKLLPCGV